MTKRNSSVYVRACDLMIQLRRFYNLGLIARNGPKCFADDSRNRCEIIIPDTVRAFSGLDRDPDEKSDGGRQRVLASFNGRRRKNV